MDINNYSKQDAKITTKQTKNRGISLYFLRFSALLRLKSNHWFLPISYVINPI